MSQMLHLELSKDGATVAQHAGLVRQVAADLGVVAAVTESPSSSDPANATVTLTSGLWVSVSRPFVSDVDPFIADFGFERGVTIDFSIDRDHDFDAQVAQLLQLTFALLARIPNDAVLHYDYADVWLLRRGGQLVLADRDDIWYPDRVALVPAPYGRGPLAFVSM
jgi:hypothetical protein